MSIGAECTSATVGQMGEPVPETQYEVTCPHCNKPFRETLLDGGAERYRGFKCPHCKLFVPYDRASDQDLVEPAE